MTSEVNHASFARQVEESNRAIARVAASKEGAPRRSALHRRPGREQGVALEMLGHAVEYLIDSRMFLTQTPYTKSEEEAVRTLMRLNRDVFESCPVVVPVGTRVRNWLQHIVGAEAKAA